MPGKPNADTATAIAATFLLMVLVLFAVKFDAQDPTPTPKAKAASDKAKSDADAAAAAAAKPAPTPEPDFWHDGWMLGDFEGDRTRLKEKGVEMDFKLTQFYQGVAHGGLRTGSEYTGRFQTGFKFDLGKLWGWKFWSAEINTETRFGGPLLFLNVGTITPVNTAAVIPSFTGNAFSVGTVSLTRLIPVDLKKGNLFAFSFGRFNLVDLSDEHFFGDGGIDKFWNMAQIAPLTVLRQVPIMTNGASFAYVKHGEPFITFAVIDPNDHSLDPGLSDLFTDGVTFVPGIYFHTKYFGKSAEHSFGGAITTKALTPFDAIRQVIIPGPQINPVTPKRGSWSVNYVFRQYLVERARKDGWGFFSQVSFADKDTAPVTTFFDLGLGGNGLFKGRRTDEFGVSYAYTDLSSVLKDNLAILPNRGRLVPEHQFEAFYNIHLTPWLRLTGDLQIIRPNRPIATTAVVPGGRLEIIF